MFAAIGLGLTVAQMIGGASERTKGNKRLASNLQSSLFDLNKREGEIGQAAETQREVAHGDYQEEQKARGQEIGRAKGQTIKMMEESNTEFARDTNKEGDLSEAVESMDTSWEESKRRNTMQLDKVMASIDQFEDEERLAVEGERKRLNMELEGAKAKSGFFSNLWG
jgi:hypothetical protein